jgi:hypothetical protein
VLRFKVSIEGSNWEDVDEIELPRPPDEGNAIDTKYGTCIVIRFDQAPETEQYAGTIVCRLP